MDGIFEDFKEVEGTKICAVWWVEKKSPFQFF
jgi:hypothetical protein